MTKKYELVKEDNIEINGHKLYRIRALIDIRDKYNRVIVRKDELGGYVENESNLSHEDSCWIYDDAKVYNGSVVKDHAKVQDNAIVSDFSDILHDAQILDNVKVSNYSQVFNNAKICNNANVSNYARVFDHAEIHNNAEVTNYSSVFDYAKIYDNAKLSNYACVISKACVFGNAIISDDAKITDYALVGGNSRISGRNTVISCHAKIDGNAVITSNHDYFVFKNNWSSGRYFTYTKSNKMWSVGCFYGTGEELIEKAYKDSEESGRHYEAYVNLIKSLEN